MRWNFDIALSPRCAGCGTIIGAVQSPIQRRKTVAGAFKARDKPVAASWIILVDDVLTTRSTAEA